MTGTAFEGAIVAAGHGERLRAGGELPPKPLVELNGEPLLLRQARTMLAAGAARVLAVVNSETARLLGSSGLVMPAALRVLVRDTPNSMESLFALGEQLSPGRFVLATVDAVTPPGAFERFALRALAMTGIDCEQPLAGVLGTVAWRGERRPLFVEADPGGGLIRALGADHGPAVTAGAYVFSTRIFDFVACARAARLGALREFLAALVASGLRLRALELEDAIDIDETADLEAARAMLARWSGRDQGRDARSGV